MIPEPCPSGAAQLHRCSLLQPCQQVAEPQVTPATLLLHTVTSCYLLMAFITKLNTKKQHQGVKISVRPPPSPNFLPLCLFILTGSHLFPQLVGSVTTETSLAALSQNAISKQFQGI